MPNADTLAVHFPVMHPGKPAHTLTAIGYYAAGDSPAPLALFLHGLPGSEQHHDLAQLLRRDGWHVLVLHFSGCWGSGGTYDLPAQIIDARAALDFALSEAAPRRANPDTVAVMGFSMGSRAALLAALEDARIGAVISVSGFADFEDVMVRDDDFEASAPLLAGVTGADVAAQFRALGGGVQPYEAAAQLAPRPVLVIHGSADEIVPAFNAAAFSGEHIQQVMIEGANHTYADHRESFVATVRGFMTARRS